MRDSNIPPMMDSPGLPIILEDEKDEMRRAVINLQVEMEEDEKSVDERITVTSNSSGEVLDLRIEWWKVEDGRISVAVEPSVEELPLDLRIVREIGDFQEETHVATKLDRAVGEIDNVGKGRESRS